MAKLKLIEASEVKKYRLYPSKEQSKYLDGCFGATRFVWNYAVGIITFHNYFLEIDKFLNPKDGKKVYYPNILKELEYFKELNNEKKLKKHLSYMTKSLSLTEEQVVYFRDKEVSLKKYKSIVEGNFKKFLKEKCYLEKDVIDTIFAQTSISYTLLLRDKCLGKLKNTSGYEWLKQYYSGALNDVIYKDLQSAIKRMYTKVGNSKFPRFKNRDSKKSFQNQPNGSNRIIYDGGKFGYLSVPKLKDIKMRVHREYSGELRTVTISKNPAGEYYAACLFSVTKPEVKEKIITSKTTLGVDRGIVDLLITSNGQKFSNPKNSDKNKGRVGVLQKRLQKQRDSNAEWKTSKRYYKNKLRLAKKINNVNKINNDLRHKITATVSEDKSVNMVVLEKLNIAGMKKNRRSAKAVSECAWYEIERQLDYKLKRLGKKKINVDRFFPSSQLCSNCGHRHNKLSLKERSWTCANCGILHDRDINAAVNLKKEGFKLVKKGLTKGID